MTEKKCNPKLQIVHNNEFGYIGKCPCCNEIQFCLGNIVSFMPEPDFLKLYNSFRKIDDNVADRSLMMPNGKRIMLRTPVDNFLLSLSINEFRLVMDLFERLVAHLRLAESLRKVEIFN